MCQKALLARYSVTTAYYPRLPEPASLHSQTTCQHTSLYKLGLCLVAAQPLAARLIPDSDSGVLLQGIRLNPCF